MVKNKQTKNSFWAPTWSLGSTHIEKATASAADLWDPRLGCLDAWMLVFLIAWRQI